MALRKEPARRYQSVEQFSEDIRRYLTGLPVLARKDTFSYRAGKFARRHKAGVATLALLVAFAVALAVLVARIARERDRASQAAATAEAVTQSLVSVFEFADPGNRAGNAITAKEMLDQGAEKVVRELKDQPAVQAKLMDTIGGLYLEYRRVRPRAAAAGRRAEIAAANAGRGAHGRGGKSASSGGIGLRKRRFHQQRDPVPRGASVAAQAAGREASERGRQHGRFGTSVSRAGQVR